MNFTLNEYIILLSAVIVCAYVFNIISRSLKIPSVLLLILFGIGLKLTAGNYNVTLQFPASSLELMGTLGLILIVLEASLDLKLSKEEAPVIKKAFLAAIFILLISSITIAFIIKYWILTTFKKALINAIPLAVISSAIAIPSVSLLNKRIKEFIIYEATFSDIAGILLFNYALQDSWFNLNTVKIFGLNILLILLISFAGSLFLIFLINKIKGHIKSFLILSVLILIYAIGKVWHLPSLLLVLLFGLMIHNPEKFIPAVILKFVDTVKLKDDLILFKNIIEESAFVIRTFFFVLFGFSIDLDEIMNINIIYPGLFIISAASVIRYAYLKVFIKTNYITKSFISPRGLITVLLFYSIPPQYILPEFSIGIVFFVIIISGILLMVSLQTAINPSERLKEIDNLNKG